MNKYLISFNFLFLIFVCFIVCLSTFSCGSFSSESEVRSVGTLERGENGDTESVKTETRAIHLAQRHIAIRNYNWAEVSKVIEQDNHYRVEFETPQQEVRLLGQRALMVNKDNGLVSAIKRR